MRTIKGGAGILLVSGFVFGFNVYIARSQPWVNLMVENDAKAQAVAPKDVPDSGTFWSLQRTNDPPLPFNPFPEAEVYYLGYNNAFLVDDSSVDYVTVERERDAERMLLRLEWQSGWLTDEEYWSLGGGTAMQMSSLASSFAYGNPVFLTDIFASSTGAAPVTASFSIAGGTNNVPYDILVSTNVASPIAQWNWLGIGYTSNRYSFSNQPLDQAFYILAKPQKTMVVAWGEDGIYQQTVVRFGLSNALSAAGGLAHSLAVRADGSVVGWGNNYFGQINIPTNVVNATMVAAGFYHSVTLLTNGTVVAWGYNGGGFYNLTDVPPNLTNITVISAQYLHTLALTAEGKVIAWGYNASGETNIPAGLSNIVAIAAGYQHNLVVKSNGTLTAWGYNGSGQCNVPANLSNVVDVAAGVAHSLALRKDGTVVAWGGNTHGETNVPAGLTNVVAIAAGGDLAVNAAYSIALKNDGTIVAWGNGDVLNPLGGMKQVIAISGGPRHALAVRTGPRTPVITLQPTNQYQIAGGSVTFNSKGMGLYAVGYQWKSNGVVIAGATNRNLTLTNVQASFEAAYNMTVSNEVGSITSSNANFYLVGSPIILSQSQPTNPVVIFHQHTNLSVVAAGTAQFSGFPLSYRWALNGTNLNGSTSNNFTVFSEPTSEGTYTVTVTNAAGSTNASWQVGMTYLGSYIAPGTLAYHLATNAVGRTNGYTPTNMVQLSGWSPVYFYETNFPFLTNSTWSTNFWLKGVQGLSATSIGYSNGPAGQGAVTMVSPAGVKLLL